MTVAGQVFDVAVVGAGPAGAVSSYLLANAGLRVVLMDRLRVPAWRPTEMLAPAVLPLLHGLGLADELENPSFGARSAIGIRRSWGGLEVVDDFIFRPGGHGYFIDRRKFDTALRKRVASAGADSFFGYRVERAERSGGRWFIRFSGDAPVATICARFMVDATGRAASVARRIGAIRRTSDRLVAIVDHTMAKAVRGWLTIEACSDGWRYCADGDAVIVCDATGGRRGRNTAFDASSAWLQTAAGEGWVAVGDAACAFDPIAGQGLFQALASGCAGAEAISAWFDGTPSALDDYSFKVRATWFRTEGERYGVYASEMRWLDSPFWSGRARAAKAFARLSN